MPKFRSLFVSFFILSTFLTTVANASTIGEFSQSSISQEQQLNCIRKDEYKIQCDDKEYEYNTDEQIQTWSSQFWLYIGIIIGLVLFAGLMSGLTIGLMSLSTMDLEIMQNAGNAAEKKYASILMPLIKRHHLLLVTLLLANAVAMEALPIFLDRITSPVIAIIISVTMVLLFGEVFPQALCSRYAVQIGSMFAWFVKFLMIILFVIAWPLSKLLDLLLGNSHTDLFERQELKELVTIHGPDRHGLLTIDEMTIIKGALDMRNKKVSTVMTPLESVYMLPWQQRLDKDTIGHIYKSGHSRIPIYRDARDNIVGLLYVKRLILLDPNDAIPLSSLDLPPLPTVPAATELYDMLNQFQEGKSHMVSVSDGGKVLGVVTLEDVIEELIQEEIIDETDVYVDVAKHIRVRKAATSATPKILRNPRNGSKVHHVVRFSEKSPLLGNAPTGTSNDPLSAV